MTIAEIVKTHDLSSSTLVGFYGGGNYGDELLLEVLANMLKKAGFVDIAIMYQRPQTYSLFHHDFGYPVRDMHDAKVFLHTIFKHKNIIIGGGGLWGLDVNGNIFLLSLLLFLSRWVLGKKVYLLGVGYYNSTGRLGRVSAWLAGKAASVIIARDAETLSNFHKYNRQTFLDTDIAWYTKDLDLGTYDHDVRMLDKKLKVTTKTLFITLRRFRAVHNDEFIAQIAACIAANQDKPIIVALLEPKVVDPEGYNSIHEWQKKYANVQAIDFSYNPLALFLFFQQHCKQLVLVGPQYHILITAHLAGVPFMPLVYDNKVAELFKTISVPTALPVTSMNQGAMQVFIDNTFRSR